MASSQRPQRFGDLEPSRWPGERLGLPDSGQHSVARFGRRTLAIFLDWGIAALPAFFLIGGPHASVWNWLFFILMQIAFIPTIGGSIGHRICGMRVVPLTGGWVGLWRPVVRTVLIALVLPVLVWDSDHRGFHDKIAGTVLVRA